MIAHIHLLLCLSFLMVAQGFLYSRPFRSWSCLRDSSGGDLVQTTSSSSPSTPKGRGFGKIVQPQQENDAEKSSTTRNVKSRSEKKKEYQQLVQLAKRTPSLKKLVSGGSGSKKDNGGIDQKKMAPRGFG